MDPAYACSYRSAADHGLQCSRIYAQELGGDPEKAFQASVARLRIQVLGHQKARNIEEICQCWNGGHIGAKTTPGYFEEVRHHYFTETLA